VSSQPTNPAQQHARPPAREAILPELLAPAGDWDCARAAVENGADAIYFGLERFNARMRARNFTEADLPGLIEYLHRRGVKGYVTLNTLVFQDEIKEAEQYLRGMIVAGVDAVIVQDVGLCRLIRQLSPDFPIHASTQMTITSAGGIEFARELGCNLVVLARECSLVEIEKMQAQPRRTEKADLAPELDSGIGSGSLPLEVFVHGALCVAYSGQCLTSEALGGRSANRGECAQACRMPYELMSDGTKVPLGNRRYLLSPQDLAGLEVLPELARLGVASLKIEGRLKSPEYVANITRIYRRELDKLALQPSTKPSSATESAEARASAHLPSTTDWYQLEMAFSRGLFTGWFRGLNNQRLVHAHFGKKRGVYLGQVNRVTGEKIGIELEGPLKPGDGIVVDAGRPEEREEGGRVYALEERGGETLLSFGQGDIDFRKIQPGHKLWKTSDPELERELRRTYTGEKPRFQRPISFEAHGRIGSPLTLIVRDECGHVAQVCSNMPLARAEAQPITTARLIEQLGRLGGTPFKLGQVQNHLEGPVILPLSELNRLRRELAIELERLRVLPKRWTLRNLDPVLRSHPVATADLPKKELGAQPRSQAATELIVLVRTLGQFEAALKSGVATLYCEFEDPKRYREAVQQFRAWSASALASPLAKQPSIFVAPPRIFKMGEEWVLKLVRSSEADGFLVRNYDHLKYFAGSRCVGDYSLNIANSLAADYFRSRFGLERLTASYDLNFAQLEALLRAAPPDWFEVAIHQHMPMFHMEHCVFCAFLSKGTDYTNCGRPCDKHQVHLRDRVGADHPVKADAGCRNTVYNARAQTGAEHALKMIGLGVRHFRIEFLDEAPELVAKTIDQYRRLLRGELSGTQVWRELKLQNQLGVTRGQIERVEQRRAH
jgi:U32 family peptidase